MSKWIKKYWWVLLIAFVAIVAPLVMNWIILQPQKFEVVGDGTHWLGFWATYISAVASFAMVVITWVTLKQSKKQNELILQQNKEQLNELKRQWEEEHRPYIIFTIQSVGYGIYHLKITNTGKSIAKNITFELNTDYLKNHVPINQLRQHLQKIGSQPLQLLPQQSMSFAFTYNEMVALKNDSFPILEIPETYYSIKENFDKMSSKNCEITGLYNDKYLINQTVGMKNHPIDTLSIEDSIPYIHGELLGIKNNLDIIAKKIDNVLPKEETE